jgi:hypothetical protein
MNQHHRAKGLEQFFDNVQVGEQFPVLFSLHRHSMALNDLNLNGKDNIRAFVLHLHE